MELQNFNYKSKMQNPLQFYESEKLIHESELTLLKKKLATSSTLRLIVFIGLVLGIYFFFNNINIVIGIIVAGISLFIFLVSKHSDLQDKRDFTNALIRLNKTEIQVLNNNYFDLDEGTEFIDSNHYYSYDIDLFGKGSFFQYSNRTVTNEGRKRFVRTLLENNVNNINLKQEAIKELANLPKWRQHFSASASLAKVQYSAKSIIDWIHNYKTVFPSLLSFLPIVFSIISVLMIVLLGMEMLNFQILVVWFFTGLGISVFFLKNVNKLYEKASKAKDTFKQYHKLLDKIESATFTSKILLEKQYSIQGESQKASEIFGQFSKILDALDQRNNILIAIVANGMLLRDLKISNQIEKWIENYHHQVENWFEVIAFFDAENSLANYAYNHPESVYPIIHDKENTIEAKDLGHPLIKQNQRVNNNFLINNQEFYIVTGANMAGKSTFLRTVSLSIVMANMGLPVCAKKFEYAPIKLITSMRTSDSLADDTSYFFSELKRLKFIVDAVSPEKSDEKYFIILDEILKGTNSTDKAIGSKKFVQKLVTSKSTGIIATHDLSLCEIEKELNQIRNYYFDAEIIDDELHFDYQIKKGICKNMNASFLLKKMEIV